MNTLKTILKARSDNATDVFLVPKFAAKRVAIYYDEGVLDKQNLKVDREVLKRSGFKFRLLKEDERLCGLESSKHLRIICDLVTYQNQQWLIGRGIQRWYKKEWTTVPLSRVLQLHVLQAKGFLTIMPLCSWLSVCGVETDGSAKTRPLPSSTKLAIKQLEERIAHLNEVLRGKRAHYWQSRTLYGKTKRRLPVKTVDDLLVGDVYTRA